MLQRERKNVLGITFFNRKMESSLRRPPFRALPPSPAASAVRSRRCLRGRMSVPGRVRPRPPRASVPSALTVILGGDAFHGFGTLPGQFPFEPGAAFRRSAARDGDLGILVLLSRSSRQGGRGPASVREKPVFRKSFPVGPSGRLPSASAREMRFPPELSFCQNVSSALAGIAYSHAGRRGAGNTRFPRRFPKTECQPERGFRFQKVRKKMTSRARKKRTRKPERRFPLQNDTSTRRSFSLQIEEKTRSPQSDFPFSGGNSAENRTFPDFPADEKSVSSAGTGIFLGTKTGVFA